MSSHRFACSRPFRDAGGQARPVHASNVEGLHISFDVEKQSPRCIIFRIWAAVGSTISRPRELRAAGPNWLTL
jgi:hypothetical protein